MPDYDNTNRGILFREQEKKSEKSPDFTGKINVNGKDYRLAGWMKVGKTGTKFTSLAVSEFLEKPSNGGNFQKPAAAADNEW